MKVATVHPGNEDKYRLYTVSLERDSYNTSRYSVFVDGEYLGWVTREDTNEWAFRTTRHLKTVKGEVIAYGATRKGALQEALETLPRYDNRLDNFKVEYFEARRFDALPYEAVTEDEWMEAI